MGEYARPIEVRGGKGGEGEVRAPQVEPLSSPAAGPDYAGQSLGAALGDAVRLRQPPSEDAARLGPIGQLRHAAQAGTAKAVDGLRTAGLAAEKMEGDLQRAVGQGLCELKQRMLEIFTTRYKPSGLEGDAQHHDFQESKERFAQWNESGRLRQSKTENAPPSLETKNFTPEPHLSRRPEQQVEQKRQIRREGRTLGD
ncbi:MAG: hypothetical protein PHO89_10460 [Methylacidiphilaceae bacterium]|nr:hypothetical protein [Candidatus Methylacidiphilaceae bacterium]